MSKFLVALAALAAAAVRVSPAMAQTYYPWCAIYSGDMEGGTNCGFSTLEQCKATVAGIGGTCDRNPFYTGGAETRQVKRAHRPAG